MYQMKTTDYFFQSSTRKKCFRNFSSGWPWLKFGGSEIQKKNAKKKWFFFCFSTYVHVYVTWCPHMGFLSRKMVFHGFWDIRNIFLVELQRFYIELSLFSVQKYIRECSHMAFLRLKNRPYVVNFFVFCPLLEFLSPIHGLSSTFTHFDWHMTFFHEHIANFLQILAISNL